MQAGKGGAEHAPVEAPARQPPVKQPERQRQAGDGQRRPFPFVFNVTLSFGGGTSDRARNLPISAGIREKMNLS
jgi:hypothetical protein